MKRMLPIHFNDKYDKYFSVKIGSDVYRKFTGPMQLFDTIEEIVSDEWTHEGNSAPYFTYTRIRCANENDALLLTLKMG